MNVLNYSSQNCTKFPGKFLQFCELLYYPQNFSMSKPNYEKITTEVFPELDTDLVPYIASILEENQKANADELTEVLTPFLVGYEVCSEEEIAERCKKLPSKLVVKEAPKK